jgi:pimeloyl-ACP methyl ester carboxylesterase
MSKSSLKIATLANGTTIAYKALGSAKQGPTLICLTGINSTHGMWNQDFISRLVPHFRVIVYDYRGIGASRGRHPYTIKAYAEDAHHLIKHLKLAKSHVLGISMGGMIALELALSYPDSVDHLILGATTAAGWTVRPHPSILKGLLLYVRPQLAAQVLVSRKFIKADPSNLDNLVDDLKHSSAKWQVFAEQLAAIAAFDRRRHIAKIKAPTLVIAGTADQMIHHDNSRFLTQRISRSRLCLLPGVGHLFPRERPDVTANAITKFVFKRAR